MTAFIERIMAAYQRKGRPGGYREIMLIAYPLIIVSASHTVMQFFDRKFLAANSTIDVAAAHPAGVLSFTLFCFFMVSANFTSALVAQAWGAKKFDDCVKASWNGFYFGLAAAFIVTFALPPLGELIIEYGNHAPELMAREKEYFKILMPGGAFICLGAPLFAFFSGRGKTMLVAIVNTGGCALNLLLNWIFIFGNWGCPPLGIFGAGLGTALSSVVTFFCIFIIFLMQPQRHFKTRHARRPNRKLMTTLLTRGAPSGMQVFFELGAFTLVSFLIGHLGAVSMAATTIALSVCALSFLPLLGTADATSIVVGQYIGREQLDISEAAAKRSWRLAICYMTLCSAVYLLFPEFLIGWFSPDNSGADFAEVIRVGKILLICAAIFNFFDATKFIFMGALRGAGDTRAVMVICIASAWLLHAPGVWILAKYFKADVVTIWIYITCYIAFESTLIYLRFRTGAWKKFRLIEK
jgi:MATE family, multidrug efflux pump